MDYLAISALSDFRRNTTSALAFDGGVIKSRLNCNVQS